MKTFTFLMVAFILLTACYTDKNTMPEVIEEIVEMSQNLREHLSLHLEIKTVEKDSLLTQIYLGNSSATADTLYHSSSFPFTAEYWQKRIRTLHLKIGFFS